jgi:hypothetical protein
MNEFKLKYHDLTDSEIYQNFDNEYHTICSRPSIKPHVIDMCLKLSESDRAKRKLIRHKDVSPKTLEKIAFDKSAEQSMRASSVVHNNFPINRLEDAHLAGYTHEVIENQNTPPELLEKLYDEESSKFLKFGILYHKNVNDSTLMKAIKDKNSSLHDLYSLQRGAIFSKNAKAEHLREFLATNQEKTAHHTVAMAKLRILENK